MAVVDTVARAVAMAVGMATDGLRATASALRCVRDAVEGILRHSWREAVERESAMLMWVAELPVLAEAAIGELCAPPRTLVADAPQREEPPRPPAELLLGCGACHQQHRGAHGLARGPGIFARCGGDDGACNCAARLGVRHGPCARALTPRSMRLSACCVPSMPLACSPSRCRHSLLGAELVAAGFVVASREMVYGGAADPFRLPRAREEILEEVGRHYFGTRESAAMRRKWVKDERSRKDMTAEFQAVMPAMCAFVADWLAAARWRRPRAA